MLRAIVRPSPTIRSAARSAAIIAASAALLLPLPPRCLGCSFGQTDCTHAKTAQPSHRSCCEHRTNAHHPATPAADCQNHAQSKTCGCKLQVPDRTYVAADRQTVPADLVAILPAFHPILTFDPGQADRSTTADGNLPPPVPHRILHCSWII